MHLARTKATDIAGKTGQRVLQNNSCSGVHCQLFISNGLEHLNTRHSTVHHYHNTESTIASYCCVSVTEHGLVKRIIPGNQLHWYSDPRTYDDKNTSDRYCSLASFFQDNLGKLAPERFYLFIDLFFQDNLGKLAPERLNHSGY